MKLLTHEQQWGSGATVIAFGMFDGVHKGHARLMETANRLAVEDGLTSVAYTFSSHPMAIFAPERVPAQIDTRSQRIRSIAEMGMDAAILRPFDRAFAALTPEEFVRSFCSALNPAHVVIGFNYTFGCKGAGKAEDMVRLGKEYGFETHVVDAVMIDGKPVSSTRTRSAILEGDMQKAQSLLGRPYAVCGVVMPGKQLGRTLDFPTANINIPTGKVMPPRGVYAARATLRGKRYMAAVNIGKHPTAPQGEPTIEANLLDYDGKDCYGCHMRLELVQKIRDERKFESLKALRDEVMRNREQVRRLFGQMDRQLRF